MAPPDLLDRVLDSSLLGYTRLGPALRRRRWTSLPEGALEGQTVVVTGATSGIGRAAAIRMGQLGASVVIVGRNPTNPASSLLSSIAGDLSRD